MDNGMWGVLAFFFGLFLDYLIHISQKQSRMVGLLDDICTAFDKCEKAMSYRPLKHLYKHHKSRDDRELLKQLELFTGFSPERFKTPDIKGHYDIEMFNRIKERAREFVVWQKAKIKPKKVNMRQKRSTKSSDRAQ